VTDASSGNVVADARIRCVRFGVMLLRPLTISGKPSVDQRR
jgi:hypothetical protein